MAYVGPGIGIGVIGSLLGGFAATVVAILCLLYYGLRWLMLKRARRDDASSTDSVPHGSMTEPDASASESSAAEESPKPSK